jgi:hypothetical protein
MSKRIFSIIIFVVIIIPAFSQDTLPRFSLTDREDKITVSWVNPYGEKLIQLNVQRSYDSLRNFTTVFSTESPQLSQNGFTEKKLPTNRIFYRIFYVLDNGEYFFTPHVNTAYAKPGIAGRDIKTSVFIKPAENDIRLVTIKLKDTIYRQIPIVQFYSFRDSILKKTKDTLIAINEQLVLLHPFVAKEVWRPSNYVYSNKDGFVNISLPNVNETRFSIKFFEETGSLLFEIHQIKESPLIFDKSNFIHAGWFTFELYEEGKLKERNKFYLPKDF